jgi:hypothetical protein
MARIDWIKSRLDNWALWAAAQRAGSLGFASQSALLLSERVDETREVRLPVDEIDAAVTDQAVSSLKPTHPELHRTLVLIYVHGIGVKATASDQYTEPSTIYARLGRADVLLRMWFNERAERQAAAKRSFTP